MAIRLLSSENVQGNIDIVLSQNAISYLAVTNDNTGVAANARVQVVGESAQLDMIATSAGYTGVTGWADSGIISTDSGASGGLKLNSQAGGIQLQSATTSYVIMDASGYVGINMSPDTAVRLSVSGAIGPTNGTEGAPTHTFYGDPDTGMFRSGANTLGFSTGGTTRLSVRAAGIDVVGETETDSLKVTGTTEFTGGATFGGNIIIYNSSNAPYIDFVENGDLSDSKARITMDQIDTNNGTLLFATENAGTLFNQMKLTQTGNLLFSDDAANFNTSDAKLNVLPTSSDVYQQWSYSPSNDNFILKLKQSVTSGNVRYVFDQINNTITYSNVLAFNEGKVGIGTQEPRGKGLEIFRAAGNSSHPQLILSTGESSSKDYGISTDVAAAGDLAIVDGVTNVAANVRLLINSSGDVGIGSTNPTSISTNTKSLSVGSSRADLSGAIIYQANGSVKAQSYWDSTGWLTYVNSGVARWYTDGSERMRLDTGGSVLIGAGATSGTPAADYRSLEIGRQGNTITGAPWKSNLYLTCNGTVTAGSTAFTYRYANEAPARMDLEDGNVTFYNAAAGTVGDTISWNQRMIVNSSGNVGIGVTSPSGKLEVAGGSTLGLRLSNAGDQSAYDQVRFTYSGYNSGSPVCTIMPLTTPGSGNVNTTFKFSNTNGTNATSNNNANVEIDGTLQVGAQKGSGETTLILRNYDADLTDAQEIQNSIRMTGRYWSGSNSQLVETRINSVHQIANGNGGSAMTFMTQTGGDGPREVARFTREGNMGLNVTSPTSQMELSRSNPGVQLSLLDPDTTTGAGPYLRIMKAYSADTADRKAGIVLGSNAGNFGQTMRIETRAPGGYWGDMEMRFIYNSGGNNATITRNIMTLKQSGNVGINQSSPTRTLHVEGEGSGTTDVFYVVHGNGSHTGDGITVLSANTGKPFYVSGSVGSGFAEITTAYNANPNFRISGDVVAYATSDKRFKDNLKVIENPIDKVQQLNGYTFDWNDKQDLYKGKDYGVVAQEVEKVMPEIVDTRFDGHKAVKYEKVVPLLIEAIKELKAEIEELKKSN